MNQSSQEHELTSQEPASNKSDCFHDFMKQFDGCPCALDKLRFAIDFMRMSLSQNRGTPFFKGFWEARKLCLPLFKESIVPSARLQLWGEYVELTREGRRLKNLLDEESAFAVEQIEMAINSLSIEIEKFKQDEEGVLQTITEEAIPKASKILEEKYDIYERVQKKLNLMNVYASRIHALRKELIKTEMRIRHKNRFFETLSLLGDSVFPLRKELIKEVSELFIQDVAKFSEDHFSDETFSHEKVRRQVFYYREEIKSLQSCAKILTLNTQAFTKTREILSHCWDKLKGMEKELKKEFSEQKIQSSENVEKIQAKMSEIEGSYNEGKMTPLLALKQYDDVQKMMRECELTHYDVRLLKEALKDKRACVEKRIEEEECACRQKEAELEEKRKEQVNIFKESVENLKVRLKEIDTETITKELTALRQELNLLNVSKREKQIFERALKEIRDALEEKKQEALIKLSDDDRAVLDNFKEILRQRKERRQEIKVQIEEYRKIVGGSSLDFEKAIEYGELMAQEKERLEKMDESIKEIEDKINQLKSR